MHHLCSYLKRRDTASNRWQTAWVSHRSYHHNTLGHKKQIARPLPLLWKSPSTFCFCPIHAADDYGPCCHVIMSLTIHSKKFDWDRPLVSFEWEDSSFIDTLIEAHDAAGTPLELFLGTPEHSPRHNYEFPILNAICPDHILLAIRDGTVLFPDTPVVWLHDRSLNGGPRSCNGVKTAGEFHRLLKLKVSPVSYSSHETHQFSILLRHTNHSHTCIAFWRKLWVQFRRQTDVGP